MRRRILLLLTALVIALTGTGMIFAYSSQQGVAAEVEEQAKVLVAKDVIPAGTSGKTAVEKGLVTLEDVPARLVPPGALVDVVAISDQETAAEIQPGELLMPSRFVTSALAGTIVIPDDKVAISVEVADAQRVSGFVRPGLDVALFDTYAVEVPEPAPAAPGTSRPVVEEATRLLLPRATVIAVGPTALRTVGVDKAEEEAGAAETSAQKAAALVTLAVPIRDAQRVAHAAHTGRITLALLTKDSQTAIATADDNQTLFQ